MGNDYDSAYAFFVYITDDFMVVSDEIDVCTAYSEVAAMLVNERGFDEDDVSQAMQDAAAEMGVELPAEWFA